MVRVVQLFKSFPTVHGPVIALENVSFTAEPKEFYALLGPSGCGKTTLLRCIAGLETPDAGEIHVGAQIVFSAAKGINVPAHQRGAGMVFQSYAIWPHFNVFDNVAFPLTAGRDRLSRAEIRDRVEEALHQVGLGGRNERSATQLSGGQQQRLALARAIVGRPQVLLMDEPLSNLDAQLREQMRLEIQNLHRSLGRTTIYVTHDQVEALALADRIAVLNAGVIAQHGAPEDLYQHPATRFIAEFVGGANVIVGTWRQDGGRTVLQCKLGSLTCPSHGSEGEPGSVAVRPEDITLLTGRPPAEGNVFSATVQFAQFLGGLREYQVLVNGCTLRVRTPSNRRASPGDAVQILIPVESAVVIAERTHDTVK